MMFPRLILLSLAVTIVSGGAAMAQTVDVPPECRLLPDHVPAPDVAYQPGTDVHGGHVAPADLNAQDDLGRQTVIVPLTVDLAGRLQHQSIDGLELEGNLGYLEIHPDGRVVHNGRDWTSQVYLLCGKLPLSADGQAAEDVIKYDPSVTPAKASEEKAISPTK